MTIEPFLSLSINLSLRKSKSVFLSAIASLPMPESNDKLTVKISILTKLAKATQRQRLALKLVVRAILLQCDKCGLIFRLIVMLSNYFRVSSRHTRTTLDPN